MMSKYLNINLKGSKGEITQSNQENISRNVSILVNEKDNNKSKRKVGLNLVNYSKNRKLIKAKHATIIKLPNKPQHNNSKGSKDFKPNVVHKDESIHNNPQYLKDYSNDIYTYLKENESVNTPQYDNINLIQNQITTKHRRLLVEWMFKIHWKFNLIEETLFLAINLLDRYLSSYAIKLDEFQILGISALFIASKYEEIYPPEVEQYVYLTDNKVKSNDIIKMEYQILKSFQFDILTISTNYFITRYHFLSSLSVEVLYLSQFFLEFILLSIPCLNYPNSIKAASALLLSIKILKMELCKLRNDDSSEDYTSSAIWTNSLRLITGFTIDKLNQCQNSMLQLIKINHKEAGVVILKYSAKEYMNVSRFFKHKSF